MSKSTGRHPEFLGLSEDTVCSSAVVLALEERLLTFNSMGVNHRSSPGQSQCFLEIGKIDVNQRFSYEISRGIKFFWGVGLFVKSAMYASCSRKAIQQCMFQ